MATVSEQLRALGQGGILITAAHDGIITELRCAMDECFCPRGPGYFEKRPQPVSDWAPSVDHITLKSEGGQLTPDNVRLAHVLCNRVDYAIKHGKSHNKDLERAKSGRFRESEDGSLREGLRGRLQELARHAEDLSRESGDERATIFQRGRADAFDEAVRLLSGDI